MTHISVSTTRRAARALGSAVALAASVTLSAALSTSMALAETPAAVAPQDVPVLQLAPKTVAGKGAMRFDWSQKGNQAVSPDVQVADSRRPLGNGSWVCSPAGFGKKSRCYAR
ncbi:hypothetical protein [Celeribacter neptunius]|uniref:Uncharacterized protein n=1 Tax=Celeribacter neptunius TaxID=588602 RepID=A0A1I3PMA3_9RHOB|nr:hypothetical protein [Celeribacter neptunius]SFJ22156.1 hypothetical protein SAMN04487991_1715 [Celeribacter neptunius]